LGLSGLKGRLEVDEALEGRCWGEAYPPDAAAAAVVVGGDGAAGGGVAPAVGGGDFGVSGPNPASQSQQISLQPRPDSEVYITRDFYIRESIGQG
jgi:hypothetical protein